jgi:hypothetical protein
MSKYCFLVGHVCCIHNIPQYRLTPSGVQTAKASFLLYQLHHLVLRHLSQVVKNPPCSGFEPGTSRTRVRRSNHYTIELCLIYWTSVLLCSKICHDSLNASFKIPEKLFKNLVSHGTGHHMIQKKFCKNIVRSWQFFWSVLFLFCNQRYVSTKYKWYRKDTQLVWRTWECRNWQIWWVPGTLRCCRRLRMWWPHNQQPHSSSKESCATQVILKHIKTITWRYIIVEIDL